jgi:glycosyltransferase involved in cell wall biosynthesis
VHNGVELPVSIKPFHQRSKTDVVFAGSLSERKGISSLIDAWPAVVAEFSHATLHFYGAESKGPNGGRMSDYLHSRLPEIARRAVTFHGAVDRSEIAAAFSRARVAVFPSFAEAFAMVPMEAMSHGCPTIYSNRGSGSELMVHNRDGLLIDPAQPAEIAKAILRLLTSDEEAAAFSKAGRKRIEACFSLDSFVKHSIATYETHHHEWSKRHETMDSIRPSPANGR